MLTYASGDIIATTGTAATSQWKFKVDGTALTSDKVSSVRLVRSIESSASGVWDSVRKGTQ